MNERELKIYILGFLASKRFKIRLSDKSVMEGIFKGAPDSMINQLLLEGD